MKIRNYWNLRDFGASIWENANRPKRIAIALASIALRSPRMPRPIAWLGYLVEGHAASALGAEERDPPEAQDVAHHVRAHRRRHPPGPHGRAEDHHVFVVELVDVEIAVGLLLEQRKGLFLRLWRQVFPHAHALAVLSAIEGRGP